MPKSNGPKTNRFFVHWYGLIAATISCSRFLRIGSAARSGAANEICSKISHLHLCDCGSFAKFDELSPELRLLKQFSRYTSTASTCFSQGTPPNLRVAAFVKNSK